MISYCISTRNILGHYNALDGEQNFSEFLKDKNPKSITACIFDKNFKSILQLVCRRPEIIRLIIFTKSITKQLKLRVNFMLLHNYILKIVIVCKYRTLETELPCSGFHDKHGVIKKMLGIHE